MTYDISEVIFDVCLKHLSDLFESILRQLADIRDLSEFVKLRREDLATSSYRNTGESSPGVRSTRSPMNSAVSSMTEARRFYDFCVSQNVTRHWMRNKSFPVSPTHLLVENTPSETLSVSSQLSGECSSRITVLAKIEDLSVVTPKPCLPTLRPSKSHRDNSKVASSNSSATYRSNRDVGISIAISLPEYVSLILAELPTDKY